MRRRLLGLATLLLLPLAAQASPHRHDFEPTDLDIDESGIFDIDLQFGLTRDGQAWRTPLPDFELDYGLTKWLEIDLDGTFSMASAARTAFPPNHFVSDNLWLSTKMGFLDAHDEDEGTTWALGLKQGPRLPASPGSHGVGYEVLGLAGWTPSFGQFVFNFGGFVDPGVYGQGRPTGVSLGLDATMPWPASPKMAWVAQVFGGWYPSGEPAELAVSAGVQFSPTPMLDLSVMGLGGSLAGGPAYGVLIGVSPMLRLMR